MNMRAILSQVRNVINRRYHSMPVAESYVGWIRRFLFFNNRKHPAIMGEPEIRRFLDHLEENDTLSRAMRIQALSAITFLYREILNLDIQLEMAVLRQ